MNEVIRAALTSALDIDFDSPLAEIARVFEEGCRLRQIAEGHYNEYSRGDVLCGPCVTFVDSLNPVAPS